MKKKMVMSLLVAGMAASMLAGCGQKAEQAEQTAVVTPEQSEDATEGTMEDAETDFELTEEGGENAVADDDYAPPTQDLSWIPEGVTLKQSEATKDADIEKAIQEYYEIPEDFLADTRYYYNLVDLNQNGKDEYFVVVLGSYVSGTGGASALWLDEEKNLLQAFRSVSTPIIVEENTENGYQTMVMQLSGGGSDTEYVRLVNDGELYIKPEDSQLVDDLSSVTGTAIIANDTIQEFYDGKYMSLQ